MSDAFVELTARIVKAQQRLAALEVKERPLALRGWRDDFFGDVIADQYTAVSAGAGSGGALQIAHGGVYRLTAGAAVNAFHHLWLGNAADGFATLDANSGWVMIARMTYSHTTDIAGLFGAGNSTLAEKITAGADTGIGGNWVLRTRTGGLFTNVDSGVATDTGPHWHVLNVYPIVGGLRRVDYFLDGTQIATCSTNVPAGAITPVVWVWAKVAAARYIDLDTWITIPMNLA